MKNKARNTGTIRNEVSGQEIGNPTSRSLEHISFEDVIRDADVSCSAVYRRWPYKDLFFSDLLRELATAASADALPTDTAGEELVRRIAVEHLDWLETPELRHELIVEILR